jgi:hypothetical protein
VCKATAQQREEEKGVPHRDTRPRSEAAMNERANGDAEDDSQRAGDATACT